MKRTLLFVLLWTLAANVAHAATYTYHGNLQDAGRPAEGNYDIELTLYSAPSGGSVIGGPLTIYNVPVRGGSFSTEADFGPLAKSAGQAFVGVRVRAAGNGDYAALDTRAAATPETNTSCPGSWSLDGNAGNPVGTYLGTADANHFLILKTEGSQVANAFVNGAAVPSWVGGGSENFSINANGSFIGGGGSSSFAALANAVGPFGTVGGGQSNQANGDYASVLGGLANIVNGADASIGGGNANAASAQYTTVAGGLSNTASAYSSAVSGGQFNTASGGTSFVAGGFHNTAGGTVSFAAGTYAQAADDGSFVWSDRTATSGAPFVSSGGNQFLLKATGGVGINTANGPKGTEPLSGYELAIRSAAGDGGNTDLALLSQTSASNPYRGFSMASEPGGFFSLAGLYNNAGTLNFDPLMFVNFVHGASGSNSHVAFNTQTIALGGAAAITVGDVGNSSNGNGAYLTNTGVWTNASSRTFKESFARVDALGVLDKLVAMPVQTWFYRGSHADGMHMGPVAEDFAATFGLGNDEKHIGTVDESGVAFAAIQGLNQKVESENAKLKSENAALRSTLEGVLGRLAKLETAQAK